MTPQADDPDTPAAAPGAALRAARRVLELEGAAVLELAQSLPADFEAAVELILATRGRVIVTGIGKSGHVGRKLAATLASTGTPAFFVHAAEASHGDLGMLTPLDLCLAISNSGETAELTDIIAHCARFAIPLVGMSKRPDSTLMRAARLRLTLPDRPEACAIGMAPTTSTTMMMALGDALAVALMELRGFRGEEFRTLHPGGRLGARLLRVANLMHAGEGVVPAVPADMPMPEVILVMTSRGFGVAGVVDDDGRLAGAISDGDLRRNMERLMQARAGEIASRSPATVRPDALAAEALEVMNRRKIGVLFVVDGAGRPVGMLHIHDCLRAGVA